MLKIQRKTEDLTQNSASVTLDSFGLLYFQIVVPTTTRNLEPGGEPYEWSQAAMDAQLKTVLERCKTINPPVSSEATSWARALEALD